MKTKAAILYEINEPLQVEELTIPDLQPGQVLVKLAYSGVCRSQLMEVRGHRGKDKYLPHLLGHEGTGRVVDIGQKVKKVSPGDYVILSWIVSSGSNAGGTKYQKGETVINAGPVTTFSGYSIVSENRCVKLPDELPLDVGALLGCAFPTGAGMIFNEINLQPESSIAIFGLGGVGISALVGARVFRCRTIIAVDVENDKLELARDLGAHYIVNGMKNNPVEIIRDITNDKGVDYSIEAAGLVSTIEQAFESVRMAGGLCVFATHPKIGNKIKLDPFDFICGKQIKGSWGGKCDLDRDIPRFARLYAEGKLPLDKLINQRYSLEAINTALEDLELKKVVRALIEIDTEL